MAEGRRWPLAGPGADDIEQERRALRDLIDRFPREHPISDAGDFYRNVGRYIFRAMIEHAPRHRR